MRFRHIPAYTFNKSGLDDKEKPKRKKDKKKENKTKNEKQSKSPKNKKNNKTEKTSNKIFSPGPGSYETQTKFIYSSTRPKSPNYTFNKKSKEEKYPHEIIAAPGSYKIEDQFVNESTKTKFPQYSFWKTSGIIPRERKYNNKIITAPGCYDVKYNQDSTKKSNPKYSFGIKTNNKFGFDEEKKLNVDNCENSENKNNVQKSNFRYNIKEQEHYTDNCNLRNKNRFCKDSIKYTISKAERMKMQRQFTPGPGRYEIRKNLGDDGSYKYSFGHQQRLLPKHMENKHILWRSFYDNKNKKNYLTLSRSSYKKPNWVITNNQRIRQSAEEPVALMEEKMIDGYKIKRLLLEEEENDTDPRYKLNPFWVIGSQRYYKANIS